MTKGQDPGHAPVGYTWTDLVTRWRDEVGSWPGLAEELVRRAGDSVELPADLSSVEKGLKRLARRGHEPGGQYGRWVERFFGVPSDIVAWVRWLGQYHSRFADLPVSLRRQQLALWDRPPIRDATLGVWIDLGVASVGMRDRDRAITDARVQRAENRAARAGIDAELELALLTARIASDDGDHERVIARLDDAAALLERADGLSDEDRACYRARRFDALAYRALNRPDGVRDLDAGEAFYRAIDEGSPFPFVAFRRAFGLAYCVWKRGDATRARALVERAIEHAGDGGFVRLRVMALNMGSQIATGDDAAQLRARAARCTERLEDEDLLSRLRKAARSLDSAGPRAPSEEG